MSHYEKPVLLLPTRPLLVPCDYDPAKKKVELRQYVFGYRYQEVDLSREYFKREPNKETSR